METRTYQINIRQSFLQKSSTSLEMITRNTTKKLLTGDVIYEKNDEFGVKIFFKMFISLILRSMAFLFIAIVFCFTLVFGLVFLRVVASTVIIICDHSLDFMTGAISTSKVLIVDDMICSKFWSKLSKWSDFYLNFRF